MSEVENAKPDPALADHVVEAVDAVAKFHTEHYSEAPRLQKAIDQVTDWIGRPWFVGLVLTLVVAWLAVSLPVDRNAAPQSPLEWLELVAALLALLVSLLILSTQRREDVLAERRAQLILELSLLSDRKSAKIIALLEELRRDIPVVSNRVDRESEDMQKATDPQSVLNEIEKRSEKSA